MHYDTFDFIEADPSLFAEDVGKVAHVVVLKPGEELDF
jgi:hypothetical protein